MNMKEYKNLTGLDVWDSGNQNILRKLVDREIIHCASALVSELSQKADEFPDYYDDLIDAFRGPINFESAIGDYLNGLERDELLEVANNQNISGYEDKESADIIENIINDLDAEDSGRFCIEFDIDIYKYERDIYEHWIVTDWFANKLEEYGHKIMHDFFGMTIWCRPTTGQAILLDGVIAEIAVDMEILRGQKNEWK